MAIKCGQLSLADLQDLADSQGGTRKIPVYQDRQGRRPRARVAARGQLGDFGGGQLGDLVMIIEGLDFSNRRR